MSQITRLPLILLLQLPCVFSLRGIGAWNFSVSRNRGQATATTSTSLYAKTLTRPAQWITCSSTNELSDAVSNMIRPDDIVAEIGSSLREVSTGICQSLGTNGKAVLLDVERKSPKNTSNLDRVKAMRYPGEEKSFFVDTATFIELEKLEQWRTVLREQSDSYSVLVLDLSNMCGNDLELSALAILKEFDALWPSYRLAIIKSLSLNQWAARLVHAQKFIEQKGRHDDIPPPHVVGTVGVHEYRNTIPHSVRSGDAVLEIGCHLGTSTILLDKQASPKGYAIGVDIGPRIITGAKERYPEVVFAVGDAWKTAELLRIQTQHPKCDRTGFDAVYVDVGGLSGGDGLLEAMSLLSALINALEPRCIVIKSLCIRRLCSRLTPYWKLNKFK